MSSRSSTSRCTRSGGNRPTASFHLLTIDGIYLATWEVDVQWADFALAGGALYVLLRNPETDLVTLMAYHLDIPPALLDRARELARQVTREL